MRATRLNVTSIVRKFYDHDSDRSLILIRNTDAAVAVMVQFGQPADPTDGFDILAGDTFSIDRNILAFDMSQEIYVWCPTAGNVNNNIKSIVG